MKKVLKEVNSSLSNYWIAKYNVGFRKIFAIFFVVIVSSIILFITLQKIEILLFGFFCTICMISYIFFLVKKYGYNKRIIINDDFVVYDNKKILSDDGCRIIRTTNSIFSSRVWLNISKNKKKSAYLPEMVDLIQSSYNCKSASFAHLGGSGNSIPLFFANRYKKSKHTVVEIDANVIRVSREYFFPLFGKEDYKNIVISNSDAKDFATESKKKGSFLE